MEDKIVNHNEHQMGSMPGMDHSKMTHSLDVKSNHSVHNNHQQSAHNKHAGHHVKDFQQKFWVSIIVTIPILLLSPMIQMFLHLNFLHFSGDTYIVLILATFLYVYGGSPFLKGFASEVRDKSIGMMTLIAIAISVAYFYSVAIVFGLSGNEFFWELATLIDIMLLGHWIEMKSVMGASDALKKLAELLPTEAHIIKNGDIVDINQNELKKGDLVLVKAGEKIPTDGIIKKGESTIDESMLTGESVPVSKKVNDKVIAGSVNGDGILEIEVTQTGEESYLNKVIELVKNAQNTKSKTQAIADKAAFYLTIIAITIGVGTFIYWLSVGKDLSFAIGRMATVLVIACPHALGLAIPLVVSISTTISAQNGLLIRNRTAFENARKITTIVFDKTGTLTQGKFGVSTVDVFDKNFSSPKLLEIASALEKNSEHPIAKAIIEYAKGLKVKNLEVKDFNILKGEGVEGKIGNNKVLLFSLNAVKQRKILLPDNLRLDQVSTLVFVLVNNKIAGVLNLQDQIRKESYDAIKKLKESGIKCWMLTGDNDKIAAKVASELKLDGYFAEVLPHQKLEKIAELQKQGEFVAMTGDGINDAPALAQANIGIAIGSGTDIAAETADIILVRSNPQDISSLILFGKKTYQKMIQNIFWATGYNVVAIPLAAGVLYKYGILLDPTIGAVFMSLSTVIVAINAKTLKL